MFTTRSSLPIIYVQGVRRDPHTPLTLERIQLNERGSDHVYNITHTGGGFLFIRKLNRLPKTQVLRGMTQNLWLRSLQNSFFDSC